jgi:Zn-dependent protease
VAAGLPARTYATIAISAAGNARARRVVGSGVDPRARLDDVTEPLPYGEPLAQAPRSVAQNQLRRLLAPVIAMGAGVAKWGAILFKLKFFTLAFSMLASLWVYALAFGWQFAAGFVLLLAVHEMGHVVVLRMRGIQAGLPVFLPFLGAFVSMKQAPRTAYDEAVSGIAGPVFGVAASFVTLAMGQALDSQLLRTLAFTGFFLNLFNLLPVLPLDGGRTVAALSPRLWFVGLVLLLGYELWHPSPVIPIVLVLGAFEWWRRWRGRDSEAARAYYSLTREQRLQIGVSYVALIVITLWAMHTYPLPPR